VRVAVSVLAIVVGFAGTAWGWSRDDARHRSGVVGDAGARRVLFSTDLAMGLLNGRFDGAGPAPIDDAYAVSLALASPRQLDVRGLVVTYGNDHQQPEVRAAHRAMRAIGSDVPIVGGATEPLANPPIRWFDRRAIGDWCVNAGVRFMARELREHGPLTLFAIGPLTDIACLIENFPRAAKRIERVVALMGSRLGRGLNLGGPPVPDLDFTLDPIALEVLLKRSRIPVTFLLFEATSTASITARQLQTVAREGHAGQYYAAASAPFLRASDGIPFDANTVQWLLNPRAYRCFSSGWRVVAKQPSASPTSGNVDAFRPNLPGRRVRACDAFAGAAKRAAFVDAVIASPGEAAAAQVRPRRALVP